MPNKKPFDQIKRWW